MDLPDTKNRLNVISKLWRKTSKYLVIVEQGTNAGFKESIFLLIINFLRFEK